MQEDGKMCYRHAHHNSDDDQQYDYHTEPHAPGAGPAREPEQGMVELIGPHRGS